MNKWLIIAVAGIGMGLLGGCGKPPAAFEKPYCCSASAFYDDTLDVSVCANVRKPDEAPRITRAELFADGQPLKTPVHVHRGKADKDKEYFRTAEFLAPDQARQMTAVVFIEYQQQVFQMTVPFKRVPAWQKFRWWREAETVVKVDPAAQKAPVTTQPAAR